MREETEKESREFFENPNFVHFVGMLEPPRPGVNLCIVKLEHTYFPPGTKSNDEFFMRLRKWGGIIWTIASIPKEKMDLMKKVATETGLRIADGIPHLVVCGKLGSFPIDNERVFTLENISNHPVYKNNPQEIRQMLEEEHREIIEIFKETERRQNQKNNSQKKE